MYSQGISRENKDADDAVFSLLDQIVQECRIAQGNIEANPSKDMKDFMDSRGCNTKQLELLALVFHDRSEAIGEHGEEFDQSFNKILPTLSLKQTFKLIIALSPSGITNKIRFMLTQQVDLLMLVKSATHAKFIEMLAKAIDHAESPNNYNLSIEE